MSGSDPDDDDNEASVMAPTAPRGSEEMGATLSRRASHALAGSLLGFPLAPHKVDDDPFSTISATREALERLNAQAESSQADEHRHAVAIHYPGYNPARPYPLPMQNQKQLKVRSIFRVVQSANAETMKRYGVRAHLHALCDTREMRSFFRDAFWWIFLEFFAGVDLDTVVQHAKKNVLVSDYDIRMFFYGTGLGQALPLPPHRRPVLAEKPRTRITKEDYSVPSHVCMYSCRNRRLPDVAHVGAPRSPSVSSLSSSLSQLDDGGVSGGSGSSTDGESSRASSVSSDAELMKRRRFPLSHRPLHHLDAAVRDQIVAAEQHQLFTRMATNYAKLLITFMPFHHSAKDSITRLLPDLVTQGLYLAFTKALPYALHMLDPEFQAQLAQTVHYWMGGVERHGDPRKWPVQNVVFPHLKQRKSRSPRISRASSGSPRAVRAATVRRSQQQRGDGGSVAGRNYSRTTKSATGASLVQHAPQPPQPMRPSLRIPRTSLQAAEPALSPPGGISPKPPPSASTTPRLPGGAAKRVSLAVPGHGGVSPSWRRHASGMSPVDAGGGTQGSASGQTREDAKVAARKQAMLKREMDSMRNDLRRMITTHTFAQAHYGAQGSQNPRAPGITTGSGATTPAIKPPGAAAGGAGSGAPVPKRVANAFALGPRKRTVQLIKEDLDRNFREAVPWYNNQLRKIPLKEVLGASKFSLNNWSPLLHRFMLLNGEDNRSAPGAMSWTL